MRWLLSFLIFIACAPAWAQQVKVDLELVLAVDGSASVDYDEFNLQMGGFAAAFRDPRIIGSIMDGRQGSIAVTLMVWSGRDASVGGIDWHLVNDPASALEFSLALEKMFRPVTPGATAINFAIRNALHRLRTNNYDGARMVIDLSGDGRENNAVNALAAADIGRREALAEGVTINGLPILTDEPDLASYFREIVVGGPGAFMITANDYSDFGRAIREKLLREISGAMLIGRSRTLPHG